LFYMSGCALHQQDALPKVTEDVILDDSNSSAFGGLDAGETVCWDRRILLNFGEIVCSSTHNSVILIFLNIV
jgi:hypothetical protein